MFIDRKKCSVCEWEVLKKIYTLENMPIKLSCSSEMMENTISELSFSICGNCNTIQLNKLIPLNILYSDSHNYISVGKTWNEYFKLFQDKILPIVKNKNVLEIGCPSGKIAQSIDGYSKWFIVEPNKNKNVVFKNNIIFIETFFNKEFSIMDKIDVIIHSHLFEHIYDHNEFLKKCFDILVDDGEMFFGVPDMEYFTESNICPFLGIFFEHTVFLNKENIEFLMNRNGFKTIEIIKYNNHSLLFHCKKTAKMEINNKKIANYENKFFQILDEYKNFVDNCNKEVKNTKKDVYIFSASYNTQFLLALGIDTKNVKGILDNCKEKQGKYFYGYNNLKIFDPKIVECKDCIVIVKSGCYSREIFQQLSEINKNIKILF